MQETTPKTPNIRKMTHLRAVAKLAILQSLKTLQNGQIGSKIKYAKNMRKTILQLNQSTCAEKTTPKTPNIRKMTQVRGVAKLSILQSLKPLQNGQFGSKIKYAKNMRKTIL